MPMAQTRELGIKRCAYVGQVKLQYAIAPALSGKPQIMPLDETNAHIDSETHQTVQVAQSGLRGRVMVVAIAYALSTSCTAGQDLVQAWQAVYPAQDSR